VLARVGARVWIARIMLTWGVIRSDDLRRQPDPLLHGTAAVGVAEAGFFRD
jgi:hypothetical protein